MTEGIFAFLKYMKVSLYSCLSTCVYFGRRMACVPEGSIVFFPYDENVFFCGLSGVVSFNKKGKNTKNEKRAVNISLLEDMVKKAETNRYFSSKEKAAIGEYYLGGKKHISMLAGEVKSLKDETPFISIYKDKTLYNELGKISGRIEKLIDNEEKALADNMGFMSSGNVEIMSQAIEDLKDTRWCLATEISGNIIKVMDFVGNGNNHSSTSVITIYKKINAVLNSIDRLEVRGRDSSGISIMFILAREEYKKFKAWIDGYKGRTNLSELLNERMGKKTLVNKSISIRDSENDGGDKLTAITFTYKIAAEIGSLGDNINFLRWEIKNDPIFKGLISYPAEFYTISAHTRWASVGEISEPNCHPVDNRTTSSGQEGIIHVCLNGDIDNYLELKKEFELKGGHVPEEVTTDTKIIPIQIGKYINEGNNPEEAFRRAVNDFEGSHAISMQTDLAPGKLFLAQKGSGQAVFIGISNEHYMPTSEVYGFIEETSNFLKMDGEKVVDGEKGKTQGQIVILDQSSAGGLEGIKGMYYDGTKIKYKKKDIKYTDITSRDIDRQDFPHYFMKEISEAPVSVEKTLRNRWKISKTNKSRYVIDLDEKTIPTILQKVLVEKTEEKRINRVFFIGQGTAGVAALACADILKYYLNDPSIHIQACKASEFSGFDLKEDDDSLSMKDTLVVAISQSGTTTDTNRAVDMVKERGAYTLAIVNRRDSDLTYKVDGVIYTSTGRDIEMSVASTKAFYSQIVAGAILSLYITGVKEFRNGDFISDEIKHLLSLPACMRKVLSGSKSMENSARRLAVNKTYWAVVGSGPNKAAADEIRIKLSELCYKTISSDYVEDKKHIDLSSEPLIIVCAAGTRENVVGDIIKDTAIFHAHKSTPIVIANEGEERFTQYSEDVFHVPVVPEHLAPILNTLAGHIWGYYAALSINDGSRFLDNFRKDIQDTIDTYADNGLNVYELVLEKSFREKIAGFYYEFRRKRAEKSFPTSIGFDAASDLTLLLKYLSGRLPVSDFEIDFGKKGTALNMLNSLFECLGNSINFMARPVDAIKHQAKTVTVGTSRISEKVEGILFDILAGNNFNVTHLTNKNVIVLRNLQGVVSEIKGNILYRIDGLNLLGEPIDNTTIKVLNKEGVLKPIPSRVEDDNRLKGTKKTIVAQGNVYIGKGRKDDRSIIVIPVISTSSTGQNIIDNLLLLNVGFRENIPLDVKKKALGGKFEHIQNIVQENSLAWDDEFLEIVETKELFGSSAEKIGEHIVREQKA